MDRTFSRERLIESTLVFNSEMKKRYAKPWTRYDFLPGNYDKRDYSGIDNEHKIIATGNKKDREEHQLIYEEVYGHSTCARCGIRLDIIPWLKDTHCGLCERCDKILEKGSSKNRKPWA